MTHPVIQTSTGKVRGRSKSKGSLAVFRGIPYAKPPIGDLRWRPPAPHPGWNGVRDCKSFGPIAIQRDNDEADGFFKILLEGQGKGPLTTWSLRQALKFTPPPNESEDCLKLNIWTTALGKDGNPDPNDKKPVMVWIHGGGHLDGHPDLYPGATLAENGVVFVSIAFRLNLFGFLAHPELSAESEHGVSGNYGLLDWIQALKWVRENIDAFGGDPDNVTIFGESGGGDAVIKLMCSPLAKGLFHRAIAQSAATYQESRYLKHAVQGYPSAEDVGEILAMECGISGSNQLAQLRALEPRALAAAAARMKLEHSEVNPIVDGYALPKNMFDTFRDGEQASVPFLLGSNASEFLGMNDLNQHIPLFEVRYQYGEPPKEDEYEAIIRDRFSSQDANRLFELYPGLKTGDRDAASLAFSDELYGGKAYYFAHHSARQNMPVYLYVFARTPASPKATLGAYHGAEIKFMMGGLDPIVERLDKSDLPLSQSMVDYWTSFAATGVPSAPTAPEWKPYMTDDEQWQRLDLDIVNGAPADLERYKIFARRRQQVADEIREELSNASAPS